MAARMKTMTKPTTPEPASVIGNAFEMAKAVALKGGKPSAVKVKVKFDNKKKMGAIRKKARTFGLADKNGVTR
jgi:hypothetical protein